MTKRQKNWYLLSYSNVQKRHKIKPKEANEDYWWRYSPNWLMLIILNLKVESQNWGLNSGPIATQANMLPTELSWQDFSLCLSLCFSLSLSLRTCFFCTCALRFTLALFLEWQSCHSSVMVLCCSRAIYLGFCQWQFWNMLVVLSPLLFHS